MLQHPTLYDTLLSLFKQVPGLISVTYRRSSWIVLEGWGRVLLAGAVYEQSTMRRFGVGLSNPLQLSVSLLREALDVIPFLWSLKTGISGITGGQSWYRAYMDVFTVSSDEYPSVEF